MINNEANELFEISGLSYKDITFKEFELLKVITDLEIAKATRKEECSIKSLRLSYEFVYAATSSGYLKEGELFVTSGYFDSRCAIAFGEDGEIYLCPWADDTNAAPIVRAFQKWCRHLVEYKNA